MSTAAPRDELFAFDAVRACAALAVLLSHARSLVLLDAPDQPDLTVLGKIVFAVTGLGHQSVVLFFVVSGALVTRALMRLGERAGSTAAFAVARLCRLLVVLIPCLLLGALEDGLGLRWAGDTYGWPGTSAGAVAERLSVGTFAGNALFLQGMAVPTFGSNVPLWTLAIEAWCYVGVVCASALLRAGRAPVPALCCAVGFTLAALFVLSPTFWQMAPLWAIGAGLAFVLPAPPTCRASARPSSRPATAGHPRTVRSLVAAAALIAAVLAARGVDARWQTAADDGLGLVAACALAVLAGRRPRNRSVIRAVRAGAAFSYSLYLSHLPLLALCASATLGGRRLEAGWASFGLVALFSLAATAQAAAVWFFCEQHTAAVRDAVLRRRRANPLVTADREVAL